MENNVYPRLVIDNIPDAIFISSLKGEILEVNETACTSFGYTSEEFKKLSFRNIISEKSITEFDDKIELLFKNNNLLTELEHVNKDGICKRAELTLKIIDENLILIISRDITKQSQIKQQNTEEIYKKLFELANETIYIVDQSGYAVLANSHCLAMTGYSEEELKSVPILSLVYEEDKEFVAGKIKERLSGDVTGYAYNFRIKDKKGNIKWLYQNSTGILWDGKPAGLCVSSDITKLKNAEEALRKSEEKYRLLATSMHDVIFTLDLEMRYTYISPSVKMLRGYEPEEVVGTTIADTMPEEAFKNANQFIRKELEYELANPGVNLPRILQLPLNRKDGSLVWTEIRTSFIYDKQKKPVGVVGVTRDITSRKIAEDNLRQSEEKYRKVVENASDSILIIQEGYIIFSNQATKDILGYTDEELKASYFLSFVHPDEKDTVISNYTNRLEGKTIPMYSSRVRKKSGDYVTVEIRASRIEYEGKPATLNIVSDITDKLKAEQEIKEKNARLEELVATKNRFFSIIAHDLKSPFHGIIGLSHLLINDTEGNYGITEYRKFTQQIHETANNGFNLLQNLLDWARTQTGEIKYKPEKISLNDIVNLNMKLFKQNAYEKNIILSKQIDEEIIFVADSQMISTILRNLISNAIKFTPKGGSVTIEAILEKDKVNLSVSDTGVGIKPEGIKKLFKVDESYSNLGTENERGTGLGLILCKEFIDKHEGAINVESELSKGTKISAEFPV